MYNSSQEPLYMGKEPLYMSPTEPPMSVYNTGRSAGYGQPEASVAGFEGHYGRPASRPVSIYGTLPRGFERGVVGEGGSVGPSQFSPFPFQE